MFCLFSPLSMKTLIITTVSLAISFFFSCYYSWVTHFFSVPHTRQIRLTFARTSLLYVIIFGFFRTLQLTRCWRRGYCRALLLLFFLFRPQYIHWIESHDTRHWVLSSFSMNSLLATKGMVDIPPEASPTVTPTRCARCVCSVVGRHKVMPPLSRIPHPWNP